MTIKVELDWAGAMPAHARYIAYHMESYDYTAPYGRGGTALEALEDYWRELTGRAGYEDIADEVDDEIRKMRR